MPLRFHEALADLMVPYNSVVPDPRNANNGDVDEVVASLLVNGCYRPIYASRQTGRIVAGHNLHTALGELGAAMVPVQWVDGDDEQAVRILLADNRIAALSKMDEALLLDLLRMIEATDGGLTGTGYDERYIEDLMSKMDKALEFGVEPEVELPTHTCPNCGHTWTEEA